MQRFDDDRRIDADALKELVAAVDRLGRIRTSGLTASLTDGGLTLGTALAANMLREPALLVDVVNSGDTDIEALAPAGIVGHCPEALPEALRQRVFSVRVPEPADAGRVVVAAQPIPVGQGGRAWLSGVCPVRLVREFPAVDALDRAEVRAAERALYAGVCGLPILWEEPDAGTDEHLALVRLGVVPGVLPWRNTGTATVGRGAPIVPGGGTDDGLQDGMMAAAQPDASEPAVCYINLAGDVAAGEAGVCTAGRALVRLSEPLNAGVDIGPDAGLNTLEAGGRTHRIQAWLGIAANGEEALAEPLGRTPPLQVRAATTESATTNGLQTVDGIDLQDGDLCLVKDNGASNGIYQVVETGDWRRRGDFGLVAVREGEMLARTLWMRTASTTWEAVVGLWA